MRSLLLFIALSLLGANSARAEIWPGRHDWSLEWEYRFAEWLAQEALDSRFFSKIGISVDCADVVYGYRWIFARENDLKMAFYAYDGIISNESSSPDWDALPTARDWRRDQRFLKSLDLVMRKTSTKSLARDSYPVELSAEALIPGTFYLDIERGHHAQMIVDVDYENPMAMPLIFSVGTVPRSKNPLTIANYWSGEQHTDGKSGFRRFLWPRKINGEWSFERATNMPFYSLEQYEPGLYRGGDLTFTGFLYARIKPELRYETKIQVGLEELVKYIRARVKLVEDGYAYCANNPACRDASSRAYDDWSTPSRDRRIAQLFHEVTTDVALSRIDIDSEAYWDYATSHTVVFEWNREPVTLLQLYLIWQDGLYSSEPYDAPERRWGLDRFNKRRLPKVRRYLQEVPSYAQTPRR